MIKSFFIYNKKEERIFESGKDDTDNRSFFFAKKALHHPLSQQNTIENKLFSHNIKFILRVANSCVQGYCSENSQVSH